MVILGTRGTVLTGSIVEGPACSHCQHTFFNTFGVIRYFHLSHIPVFPTSHEAGLKCGHCRRTLAEESLPKETKKALIREFFPFWRVLTKYSGSLALGAIALAVIARHFH
ncbi:hypothetical protein ACKC9G_03570 [Pokkaliibacter sp. CJK22405]|uniref:hypothetical protein n=1 Tax=Pokkaliibacter sp. CJK22405 TaxID=3384615 RepID=UPI003985231D